MLKVKAAFLIFLMAVTTFAQSGAHLRNKHRNAERPEPTEITIPTGTAATVVLQNQLSSKINEVGDEVYGILERSIIIDGVVALKKGTPVYGKVTAVSAARRMQRQSSMTIIFDQVVTPVAELEVETALKAVDDFENERKMKSDDEGKVRGGRSGRKTVDNVLIGGSLSSIAVAPATIGVLGAGGGLGTAAATAGGILGGGVLAGVLLTKGNEIKLAPGTIFRIEFTKPITVPLTAAAPKE